MINIKLNNLGKGTAFGIFIEEGIYINEDDDGNVVEETPVFRMILGFIIFNIEIFW